MTFGCLAARRPTACTFPAGIAGPAAFSDKKAGAFGKIPVYIIHLLCEKEKRGTKIFSPLSQVPAGGRGRLAPFRAFAPLGPQPDEKSLQQRRGFRGPQAPLHGGAVVERQGK